MFKSWTAQSWKHCPLPPGKDPSPSMGLLKSALLFCQHRLERIHVGLSGLTWSSGSGKGPNPFCPGSSPTLHSPRPGMPPPASKALPVTLISYLTIGGIQPALVSALTGAEPALILHSATDVLYGTYVTLATCAVPVNDWAFSSTFRILTFLWYNRSYFWMLLPWVYRNTQLIHGWPCFDSRLIGSGPPNFRMRGIIIIIW